MSNRVAVLVGLLAGVASALLLGVALVALAPEIGDRTTASPSPAIPTGSPATSGGVGTASPSADASGPTPAGTGPASADPGAAFGVGRVAQALVVPQLGGGTIDLTNLRGQPVWVNFWGTYCPPCLDEFPLMNRFAEAYAADGLVILAIDVKEDETAAAAFATRLGATFPIGLDADGTAQERWGAFALPVHFWIDRDGVVRAGALGGIGADVMAEGLRTVLPGATVP